LVKTAFQPVSVPEVTTSEIYDIKMPIYSVPPDCAIHCLLSPARQFINLISTIKACCLSLSDICNIVSIFKFDLDSNELVGIRDKINRQAAFLSQSK
jgi:hypothetical protein